MDDNPGREMAGGCLAAVGVATLVLIALALFRFVLIGMWQSL